jgi:5-methylcytosine-specific restriction endonuclease McrA
MRPSRRNHRTPARELRRTHAWKLLAKQVVREEPVCWLRLPGCTMVSTSADHVISIVSQPSLALVRSNCRGACRSCNYRRRDTPVNQLGQLRQALARADQRTTTPRRFTHPTIPKPAVPQRNPLRTLFGE